MPRVAADQRTARAAASVAVTSTARSLTRTAARQEGDISRSMVPRFFTCVAAGTRSSGKRGGARGNFRVSRLH